MAVIAPFSNYKKNNFKIGIVVCIILTVWCAYDGYFNEKWIQEHTDEEGNPQAYLIVNRKAPAYLIGAAVLLAVRLFYLKDKKIVAEENELILSNNKKIPYDSIEKIDKTCFDSKGFFVLTYKNEQGTETDIKITDKKFDNISGILDLLVAKIG